MSETTEDYKFQTYEDAVESVLKQLTKRDGLEDGEALIAMIRSRDGHVEAAVSSSKEAGKL